LVKMADASDTRYNRSNLNDAHLPLIPQQSRQSERGRIRIQLVARINLNGWTHEAAHEIGARGRVNRVGERVAGAVTAAAAAAR
jgi:hypothetical protein